MHWRLPALLGLGLIGAPGLAAAETRILVRTGEHPGFGRIVLEASGGAMPAHRLEQVGDRVLLRLSAPAQVDLRGARRPPRNATAIAEAEDGLSITLRSPDMRVRQQIMGSRIVLDVMNRAPTPRDESGASSNGGARRAEAGATPADTVPVGEAQTRSVQTGAAQGGRGGSAPATTPVAQPVPPPAPPGQAAPQPAPAMGPPAPSQPAASAASPAVPAPGRVTTQVPQPAIDAQGTAPSAQASSAPAPASIPPPDAAAVRLVFGAPGQPRELLLPFGEDTGIAVLRRGDALLIVLDTPRPLNLAALRGDPVFAGLEARGVPGGTLLSLRLASPASLALRRRDGAWSLAATAAPPPAAPAQIEALTDAPGPRLVMRAPQAGRVLAVPDPETGLPLLVGTVRAVGPVLTHLRRLPEADLLPSLAGVAALARSDRFGLRATTEGFVLSGALALDPSVAAPEAPQAMTRLLDIPNLPLPVLSDRLRAEHAAVRAAPPLGRVPLRRAVAETLLALGMPQEAQAMLSLATAEDPRASDDPAVAVLAGAAALLGGRLAEADALSRTDLPERDETILWRALRDAARGDIAAAAPRLAATLPLALGYPPALRARLLGPIAETLAEAGHVAGLRQLAAGAGDDPAITFARAALAEAEGNRDAALAAYAAVASGRDRPARARALRRGVELRLAAGAITPAAAADALDASLFAWRGDLQEIATRKRIAALRLQAGDPRAAMTLLRETAELFPEEAAGLQPALQDAFLAALGQEAPLTAVAMHDAEPGLLPADARGDAALLGLAERLASLDLAQRATALLRPAMERAQPGSLRRAELGLRLAQLLQEDGRAEEALAALAGSSADALPAALADARALVAARAEARLGRRDAAIAALRMLGAAGAEPLAALLAEQQDWAGAARALAAHLAMRLPAGTAKLAEDEARLLLRQAALLGLAGDAAGLAALAPQRARLEGGPHAEAFAALTADPMRGLADLPRLQRELALFRALPRAGGVEPLREARLGTR